MQPEMPSLARRLRLIAPLLLTLAALAGCGLSGTNDGGYISGDGQVIQYAAADRGEPISLSGKTLTGSSYDLSAQRGKVVVVNFWWSTCGPCRKETPMLQSVHTALGDKVAFLGVNIRDNSADQGLAFERYYKVTYPSLYSPDGKATLAFRDRLSPRTVPATAVLDPQGRVAAIIRGTIPTRTTLEDIIEDAGGPAAPEEGAA